MNNPVERFNKTPNACPKCLGCGQIASDDDESPWSLWEDLKPPANLAVVMGLVRPLPCPKCKGTGQKKATKA